MILKLLTPKWFSNYSIFDELLIFFRGNGGFFSSFTSSVSAYYIFKPIAFIIAFPELITAKPAFALYIESFLVIILFFY